MTPPLVLWTARLAALCWLARWVIEPRATSHQVSGWRSNLIWTVGAGLLLAHVLAALALVHHWSHTDAWAETARRTYAVTGLDWGGGVWFNYAGVVVWCLDAARMWIELLVRQPLVTRSWVRAVHSYLAFLMLNATVVFGPPPWLAFGLVAAAVWCWRRFAR